MAEQQLESGFIQILVEDLTQGLNKSQRPTAIGDGQVPAIKNLIFDKLRLRVDTGYGTFLDTVRGTPRSAWQFYKTNGSSELLLVTNASLYKSASGEWQYVADGDGSGNAISTTTTAQANAAATSVSVASITGFSDGDHIGITLDDGTQHKTTIDGTPSAGTIDLDDPIPTGRNAPNGTTVLKAVDLSGSDDESVAAITMASQDWFIFTNNVDQPKYYDGNKCEDLPNLPSGGDVQCKAVALYYNYLILIGTTEGGTAYPQRIRWCDTGDPTDWSSGNAGTLDFYDTEDFLLAGVILGPYLILYRERSIIRLEYIGADDKLFDFDTVVTGEGLLSHDTIVDLGDSHIFPGNANVYRYQGGFDIDPIGNEIYYEIFGVDGSLIPSQRNKALAFYVEELDEIWFFYPAEGDTFPTHLARFRNDIESWTLRRLSVAVSGFGFYQLDSSRTWQELVGNWTEQTYKWNSNTLLANAPTTLLCSPTGSNQVYQYDYLTADDNGTAIDWFFETKMFYQPHYKIRTDFVEFKAKGGSITIYYRGDEDEPWQVWGTQTLTGARAKYRVHKQVVEERIQFRFEGIGGGFSLDWFSFAYQRESEH